MEDAMDAPAAHSTGSEDRRRLAGTLEAVAGGSQAAMAELYRLTSAKLYGISLRLLRDEGEAQDVLQETYVTVWRKAGAFDAARASPITWLAVLARNKAIDRLRGRRPAAVETLDAANDVADEQPSALDLLERDEDKARIAGCLAELEANQRDAIRSAFFDGASYPALAEREGVPLGTMKSWIRRGLARLRGCLER
ncbi:MAG TPA: sigma-70 family RNA polymerase sigma factor [Allosphingosinicella sp.]|jgi:RNA polymerase sigma-70 factor (ECF subfamily)